MKRLSFSIFVSLIVALAFPAIAAPQKHAHATVELISDVDSIQPGQPFKLGLHFKIDKEWHLYWRNPGDSGLEPMVNWILPDEFTVSEFNWPAPKRKTDKDHTNYIYEKSLLLTVNVTPPDALEIGQNVTIKAELDYLICRFSCVPGSGNLSLTLPVSSNKANKSNKKPLFIASEKMVPKTSKSISASAVYEDEQLQLNVMVDSSQTDLEILDFLPITKMVIENSAPFMFTKISLLKQSATFLLYPHRPGLPDTLVGVLVTNRGPVAINAPLTRGKLNLSDREKLAGSLLALRTAGHQLGWGFQLQFPVFVSVVSIFLLSLSLSLFGLLKVNRSSGAVSGDGGRLRSLAAFLFGVVVIVIAAPYTAPLSGSATGFALFQPAWVSIALLLALGLSVADPFFSFSPSGNRKGSF